MYLDRPPIYLMSEKTFIEHFKNVIENIKSHGPDFMMISGDFNDRCLAWFDDHCINDISL